jgi:hypothetical protein
MQRFNSSQMRDEEQKQYFLQIVEKHRQTFSTAAEKELTKLN